jgi:hypothetical protein
MNPITSDLLFFLIAGLTGLAHGGGHAKHRPAAAYLLFTAGTAGLFLLADFVGAQLSSTSAAPGAGGVRRDADAQGPFVTMKTQRGWASRW